MTAETLRCAHCQREVRIVRLNPELLALGHVNLRGPSHRVRLAPAARTAVPAATGQPEGSESREDARRLASSPESELIATRGAARTPQRTARPSAAPSPVGRAVRSSRGLAPLAPAPRRSTERAGAL